jgi:tetratricopeptide (TPR) repeat protein
MSSKTTILVVTIVVVATLIGVLLGSRISSNNGNMVSKIDPDKIREYASALYNRQLFEQAVNEYKKYLSEYPIEEKEQANVNYIIGDIYFERIKNYREALAYYEKVKHLFPESSLQDDVNKKIVACLERLEQSADAEQALKESTSLDEDQVVKNRPGVVVARIGSREITMGDLNFELSQIPESVRDQFNSKERKIEFLKEYIATELLYDSAKREGLDNDDDVIEGAFQAKRALMVRKLLQNRIAEKIDIQTSDVELYYKANKDKYTEKDEDGNVIREKTFDEVQQQVAQDFYTEKYGEEYGQLIQRMMIAEDVQIFDDRVN